MCVWGGEVSLAPGDLLGSTALEDHCPLNLMLSTSLCAYPQYHSLLSLFGSNPGNFEWLVVDLNFTSVVPDQCSYPDDYYPWFPTDEVTSTAGLECGLSLDGWI